MPPSNLDPHQSVVNIVDFPYLAPVYDRLTQVRVGPEIAPMLAESWQFAPDGLSADFTLRTDAVFHDGAPVDAEAVVKSLARARTVGFRSAPALSMIADVAVVDDHTVRIATTRPAADLASVLASTHAAIINPRALEDGTDLTQTTAGSGPYQPSEVRFGDRITYTRSEHYWDPDAQKAATLQIIGMSDDNARLNAFRSGQIDVMLAKVGQTDELDRLTQQPQYRVQNFPSAAFYSIALDIGAEYLADVRVRQALNYAIDREGIRSGLTKDHCAPLSQPLPAGVVGHNSDVAGRYDYNPDKARELLRAAGVPDDLKLRIVNITGLSPQQEMLTAIQAQLDDVGVDTEVVAMAAGDAQLMFAQGGYGSMNVRVTYPLPAQTLMAGYMTPTFFPTEPSPEFQDAVLGSLNPGISDAERTELYSKASGIASDEAYDIFICSVPTTVAYSNAVVGMDEVAQVDFTGIMDTRYLGKTS
ncbi:ABC transporter substrate-binding protein [Rhodococcus artemisiae]|uniref:ABC transporter substrate-binding protein n=1 Tax=Rhodococcus artemisiae TaxID=714159 RepID=A0ABU7LC99_9NOCA|nr:ABC transporter substrate-binding protein [Rhodococcus artemisiae]MEE2059177.1 ABC transporter substrate-binding protein [Rhodococcus artemisiae]